MHSQCPYTLPLGMSRRLAFASELHLLHQQLFLQREKTRLLRQTHFDTIYREHNRMFRDASL